jgi:tetratricopeptide (TPR) repeat protein
MNKLMAKRKTAPSGPSSETPPRAPQVQSELERARGGAMPLTELMGLAQALVERGRAPDAAALYENWIAHSVSPLQHVACFNWGTVLGSLNRHAEAQQAYQRALALSPEFHQARLNLALRRTFACMH